MNMVDRHIQPGSAFLIALFSTIALLFSVGSVTAPPHHALSLLMVLLSLNGAWRHYKARAGTASALLQQHEA